MATYGFGAAFSGTDDKTREFLDRCAAFVGWDPEDAPFLHNMLQQIDVGDFVFLKSFPPSQGLIIKAAGVVTGTGMRDQALGYGVAVRWVFTGASGGSANVTLGKLRDKADFMRGGTLYREFNPDVQRQVINLVLGSAP